MDEAETVEGVYLSSALDLETLFGDAFAARGAPIRLRRPEAIDSPEAVRFALCWHPPDNGFVRYPNLEMAASIASGVDNIVNCPSLPERAVVTRIRDEHQAALMAGFAAWHVIWHHRRMGFHLSHQTRGEWVRRDFDEVVPPSRFTVGILGFGLMGRAIARAVCAMGFPVVAAARNARAGEDMAGVRVECGPEAAQRTAARANVLINVLPLTAETRDILDRDLFALMPRGGALIQMGRGEHLVDADLDDALDSGRLAGASLDVFREEPLPPGHPFWDHPAITVTPHNASITDPRSAVAQIVENIRRAEAGRPLLHAVDRSAGY